MNNYCETLGFWSDCRVNEAGRGKKKVGFELLEIAAKAKVPKDAFARNDNLFDELRAWESLVSFIREQEEFCLFPVTLGICNHSPGNFFTVAPFPGALSIRFTNVYSDCPFCCHKASALID